MFCEACFCGRVGPITERQPVYCGDGVWGLQCPCGDVDLLGWLPPSVRADLLRDASAAPVYAYPPRKSAA
jgi:hypothetical protein